MRILKLYTLIVALFGGMCAATLLKAQTTTSDNGNLRLAYTDGGTRLDRNSYQMDFKVNARLLERLGAQELAVVIPAFVSQDGKHKVELETVGIAGSERAIVLKRNRKLNPRKMEKDLQTMHIVKASEVRRNGIAFSKTVAYEPWMKDARLEVKEVYRGCALCDKGTTSGQPLIADIPVFSAKDFAFSYSTPQYNPEERADVEFESFVHFPIDKSVILREYKTNKMELEKINQFMVESLKVKSGTMENVLVYSYASPEATVAYNQALTNRRAAALADYIKKGYPVLNRIKIKTEGRGEYWDGMIDMIRKSDMVAKDELLAILNGKGTPDEREWAIRKVAGGKAYKMLTEKYYPEMRKSVFKMTYKLRRLSDEDLLKSYDKEKNIMSHADLYRVAQLHKNNPEKQHEVYTVAYRRYGKTDRIAMLNYANSLLENCNDGKAALEVLNEMPKDAETLLLSAEAYSLTGDDVKAEQTLQAAAQAGSVQAVELCKKYGIR